MTTPFSWHDSYRAAVLETDWTKMTERIQAAESDMSERQRVLFEAKAEHQKSVMLLPMP